jgi:hypothetical protein
MQLFRVDLVNVLPANVRHMGEPCSSQEAYLIQCRENTWSGGCTWISYKDDADCVVCAEEEAAVVSVNVEKVVDSFPVDIMVCKAVWWTRHCSRMAARTR